MTNQLDLSDNEQADVKPGGFIDTFNTNTRWLADSIILHMLTTSESLNENKIQTLFSEYSQLREFGTYEVRRMVAASGFINATKLQPGLFTYEPAITAAALNDSAADDGLDEKALKERVKLRKDFKDIQKRLAGNAFSVPEYS